MQPRHVGARCSNLFLRHLRHIGVAEQRLSRSDIGLALLVAAEIVDDAAYLRLLTRQAAVAFDVVANLGVGQGGIQFGQTQGQAFELIAQGGVHGYVPVRGRARCAGGRLEK